MELRLPSINTVVLQDGTCAPVQLTRRCPTAKLPVPSGAVLTLSRGKLGERLYKPTTDFLHWGPCMHIMKPSYNNLHDPHLHDYFHRRDLHDKLRKGNLITDDDEVLCSLKEYNTYAEYLGKLKMVADKTYDEIQRGKMRAFLDLQEKGEIPLDVTLAEVTELLLEEDEQNLQQLLQTEMARQRRRMKGNKDYRQTEDDFYNALDLQARKADDRSRLTMIEKEFRHEQNRLRQLREAQEKRASKYQQLFTKRQDMEEPVLRSGPERVHGHMATRTSKKQAAEEWECASQQNKMQGNGMSPAECGMAMEECTNRSKLHNGRYQEPPAGEPQCMLPRKPLAERPVVRSGLARVYGHKPARPDLKKTQRKMALSEDPGKVKAKRQDQKFWEEQSLRQLVRNKVNCDCSARRLCCMAEDDGMEVKTEETGRVKAKRRGQKF